MNSNRFKKEVEKKVNKQDRRGLKSFFKAVKSALSLFKDERTHKVIGLLFLLASVYCGIAFTSFLFTWKTDQDKVAGPLTDLLLNSDLTVDNWLGKTGAILSDRFIHNGFGVTSFLFVLLFFLVAIRILFRISLLPFGKTLKYCFFIITWLPAAFSYIFHSSLYFLGGTFGYQVNRWLGELIGIWGTGFFLLFSLLIFLVLAFNISFIRAKQEDALKAEGENMQSAGLRDKIKDDIVEEHDNSVILSIETENNNDENVVSESEEENKELTIKTVPNKAEPISEENIPLAIEEIKEEDVAAVANEMTVPEGEYDPTLELSSYQFPTIDLLENYGTGKIQVDRDELEQNKNKIVETLGHYNIGIEKIKATIGPTVTLYEIVPSAGIRISKIKNLEDDIALSLSALGIRIIAPIPGKGTIGIEVPNQRPEIVSMRSVIASEKFQNTEYELPIGLGKTISNEIFVADLARMPHLLMAGATGQGKSVGLNAILISLIYKKHPSQIKFVLVDPKKVELTLYKNIERHFLAKLPGEEDAIITDTKKVVNTLNSLCMEMDDRYELLKNAQVRNIKEYNAKFIARRLSPNNEHRFLPYIVLVVDEFADLIMTAGKEIEGPIARLAQLARAIGIHLIIATQRPSVNIITGTIKANFPARIAFRVTSKIDSRTILDTGGADQLIGRGDMLLSTGADLIRLQCAFVDTPEVDKITDFIGSQRAYPDAFLLPEYHDENEGGTNDFDISDRDILFDEAARIVVQHQQGSASLLQRRLKLGYNRAGRIIDQLEASGIIGPFEGSKAREVLLKDDLSLEQFLTNLKK